MGASWSWPVERLVSVAVLGICGNRTNLVDHPPREFPIASGPLASGSGPVGPLGLALLDGCAIGDRFVHERVLNVVVAGWVTAETQIPRRRAIIPAATGSAYVTGLNQW